MVRDPNCRKCPLWEGASSVCIPGRQIGTWDGVVIVGEAPGPQEDLQGRAFVGPTGEKLASALEAIGLRNAFVTNTVRCYPYRTPSSSHVAACKGYLQEELAALKPRFILALGNTAWHQFGHGPITEHAGKEVWSNVHTCWIMPALHPAAILRDPNRERSWMADLHRFARLVKDELVNQPDVKVALAETWDDLWGLIPLLRQAGGYTFDFETWYPSGDTEKPWWHRDFRAISVAFAPNEREAYVVPLLHPESPLEWNEDRLEQFFEALTLDAGEHDLHLTAHNSLFDSLVWYRLCRRLPGTTCDTMVLAHLLDENRPKGLKYLGRALLGWPDWGIDTRDLDKKLLSQVAYYNGMDAACTYAMRRRLLADLREDERLREYFVCLEMPKVRALERLISRGVWVDEETLYERIKEAEEHKAAARAQIPVENPGSNRQIERWLYEELKLPCPKTTATGARSTDEDTLKRLAKREPRVRMVVEERKWSGYLSRYLRPLESSLATSMTPGRIFPDYRTTSVETGRLGSRFHTTPRDPFVRSVYSAPPNRTLLVADYGQIEARLAAWAAMGSPSDGTTIIRAAPNSMLSAWLTGKDVYVLTAASILEKPPEQVTRDPKDPKNERQIVGKVPTLALLYKMGPGEFRDYVWREFELEWTEKFTRQVHEGFFRTWPELRDWHEREEKKIRWRGYAVSAIGRMRHLPGAKMRNSSVSYDAVKQGINHPIQSLASDFTQASMVLLDRMDAPIVGSVHDALVFEVPDAEVSEWAAKIRRVMEHVDHVLRPLGLILPPGLLKVEIKAGPWGIGTEIPA